MKIPNLKDTKKQMNCKDPNSSTNKGRYKQKISATWNKKIINTTL